MSVDKMDAALSGSHPKNSKQVLDAPFPLAHHSFSSSTRLWVRRLSSCQSATSSSPQKQSPVQKVGEAPSSHLRHYHHTPRRCPFSSQPVQAREVVEVAGLAAWEATGPACRAWEDGVPLPKGDIPYDAALPCDGAPMIRGDMNHHVVAWMDVVSWKRARLPTHEFAWDRPTWADYRVLHGAKRPRPLLPLLVAGEAHQTRCCSARAVPGEEHKAAGAGDKQT